MEKGKEKGYLSLPSIEYNSFKSAHTHVKHVYGYVLLIYVLKKKSCFVPPHLFLFPKIDFPPKPNQESKRQLEPGTSTHVQAVEEGGIGGRVTALLRGLPELLLGRVAVAHANAEQAVCG